MKYGIVKDLLTKNGFILEYCQTDMELDMVEFTRKGIDGSISIRFDVMEEDLPQHVINGENFTYDDEWLENINVASIFFDVDISISFMSENTLDVNGINSQNVIYLHGDDLMLTEYVINLICDPLTIFNFHQTYSIKVGEFFEKIKRFIPIINKYNLPCRVIKSSGDEYALYTNITVQFYTNKYDSIQFSINVLTWECEILVKIKPGFVDESDILDIDCDLYTFEKLLNDQYKELNEFNVNCEKYRI